MSSSSNDSNQVFDFVVIGSGFGGSVSAMRLSQKGYSVAVIESGKRWNASDFPKTNWSLSKYLWMPKLFCYGIQRINLLKDFLLVSGAGVGGGSLVYACTLYVPGKKFFQSPTYSKMGGEKSLLPFYTIAKTMLGVEENPKLWEPDDYLKETAKEFGVEDTFRKTPVGIYFGSEGSKKKIVNGDPYFAGDGPERNPCNYCGGCMVGCRYKAKNTLDKNYLFFAEKLGTVVIPETKVVSIVPLDFDGKPDPNSRGKFGYKIETESTTGWFGYPKKSFIAKSVIVSGSVMGTVGLLSKMKQEGKLPLISHRLGDVVRTNSETILPITVYGKKVDFSKGIAITSSVHPDEHTHIEPVRYSKGSDFFGLLGSAFVDGGGSIPRWLKWLWTIVSRPVYFIKASNPFGLAQKSVILLVMQTIDNSVKLVRKRRIIWPFQKTMTSALTSGERTPTYIPIANEFAKVMAKKMGGIPRSSISDVVLDAPITGHIMGGSIVGENSDEGVIDYENKVHGYENLRICDASMLTVNLGVNPSLTITALTERAMTFIPTKSGFKPNVFAFEKNQGIDSIVFNGNRKSISTRDDRTSGRVKKTASGKKGKRSTSKR
ncbi:GMC oxidoreductase [Leptospira sp. GIMC2001]|uniref:GMC oxidoreductase n=1 Tax=Leptospira sp. GIMC2001 TaxID=1513297 RepID=UPI00234BDF87|nr:GMC oxidoreductase [Leptospira sp. GIMC2001]WCL49896.1 GMC oxidoreductase [Leptospira sp. GIMC2001]